MHTSNNVVMDMYIMLEYLSVFDVTHVCGLMYIYVVYCMWYGVHYVFLCTSMQSIICGMVYTMFFHVHLCSLSRV
jgi:hypothetical protein